MKLKKILPWWLKILSKIILSRFPLSYSFWQSIGLFRHGKMDAANYALKVFKSHLIKSNINSLTGKTVLELGPGDSIATAIIAHSYGAKSILLDVGKFAKINNNSYFSLIKKLKDDGKITINIDKNEKIEQILSKSDSTYLTNGLDDLKKIRTNSVDFMFSQAVLEHIRLKDFRRTIEELYRILKKDGVGSHQIDLRDHLNENLNNLRFSKKIWESDLFSKSGFYTNRISYDRMINIFKDTNFNIDVKNIARWKTLPIKIHKINKIFAKTPEDILRIKVFDVITRK